MEERKILMTLGVLVSVVLISAMVLGALTGRIVIDLNEEDGINGEMVVEDATGKEITLEEPPERIISFMPSNTELLFHLEVGDRIVGVDDFSNHPPEVQELPSVGDSMNVDYEKIIGLEPDVVVVSQAVSHMRGELEDYGERAFVTNGESLDDVYSDMQLLGELCGIPEKAEEKANELKEEMYEITENTRDLPEEERVDTFYISGAGNDINTPGNDTFQDTLLTNAGANNIFSDKQGWSNVGEEEIIDREPEVIIAPEYLQMEVKELTEKDSWQDIPAVENDHIHYVDGDIMSRPGPRIVEAQEELVNILEDVE